ncbi:unnamed protein product [Brachionus calyciflorus]|uniref:Immediate early response 3-interacting protein 1 n=1 Tax=Brachionus calyciflorus TaxID=104777 RepID=A0A813T044_9BILA|nr:unnamed protein product [Brachionus calyciflorus]
MVFGLYTLLEAGLLFVNAIAILNEERFLRKLRSNQNTQQNYGDPTSVSSQIMTLIKSVQMVMRFPLIFCNTVVILMLLLFG